MYTKLIRVKPINNDKLAVMFDYDPELIYKIKLIHGRRWNALFRYWTVPINEDNIKMLVELGADEDDIKRELQKIHSTKLKQFSDIKQTIKENYPFLYDFQIDAVAKGIVNERLLLADDMGLGKTIEALCAIDFKINKRNIADKCLVFCPNAIKWQWQREIEKFKFDLTSVIVRGNSYERKEIYRKDYNIYICNYEQLLGGRNIEGKKSYTDFWEIFRLTKDQILILDEASYIKNPKAKRTILIQQLNPKYVYALTGTPIENKLQDAHTIANVVLPNWMSNYEFYGRFCTFLPMYGHKVLSGYRNIEEFMERLMRISIRRTKEDVATQLPGKIYQDRLIEMSNHQKQLEEYLIIEMKRLMEKRELKTMMGQFVFFPMVEDSTELIKLSDAFTLKDVPKEKIKAESPKLKELLNIIDEISDEKIVIFTRFAKMANIIVNELTKNSHFAILGTGDTNKQETIEKFEKWSKVRFLVATDAYSYGVNMPFATTIINFDLCWNPARLRQREDRCHRINSKKSVKVINLISVGGLEEYIYQVIKGKEELFTQVMSFDIHKQLISFIMSR